jgi:hypothetical protein
MKVFLEHALKEIDEREHLIFPVIVIIWMISLALLVFQRL